MNKNHMGRHAAAPLKGRPLISLKISPVWIRKACVIDASAT